MKTSKISKAKKEPVKLREKVLANGNISLYLDIYRNGVNNNMKVYQKII